MTSDAMNVNKASTTQTFCKRTLAERCTGSRAAVIRRQGMTCPSGIFEGN